ncbi:MAG: hypothetical protein WCG34_12940 [Leptolinea sp.]
MPIITIKEKITKTIDIPLNAIYQIIDNLSEDERYSLIERLKSRSVRLKKFKNDNIQKIVSDFQKTDIYEDDFLKDMETGLIKLWEQRF